MKKIIKLILVIHVFLQCSDISAAVTIKLKNSRSINIPNEIFTKLRMYSPTIDTIAQEIEANSANHKVEELPLLSIDENLFRFILDALSAIASEGQLTAKLQKYHDLNGENEFKKLIPVIQFLKIEQLGVTLKDIIQPQEICFPAIKRRESKESEPSGKKLKAEKAFSIRMPSSYPDRKPIVNILKNSAVLKNSVLDLHPELKTIDAIDAGSQLEVGVTESRWQALLYIARKSDLSDEKTLAKLITDERMGGKELVELIDTSNYLDIPALLNAAQSAYFDFIFPSVVTQETINHLPDSMKLLSDIPLDILENFKNRIIKGELFKEFHWSGPLEISMHESVHAVAFSPDGYTLAMSLQQAINNQSTVMLFDIDAKSSRREVWASPVPTHLLFSQDGMFLAGTSYPSSKVIILNLKNKMFPMRFLKNYAGGGTFTNAGSLFAYVNTQNRICLYNPSTDETQVLDVINQEVVSAIAFSPNDHLLALGLVNGEIQIIDPTSTAQIKKMAISDKTAIDAISFLSADHIIVKSFVEMIYFFDLKKGELLNKFSLGSNKANSLWDIDLVWNNARTKIAGDFYSELRIWRLPELDGQQIIKLASRQWPSWRGKSSANWLAFNQDGTRLAMIYDSGVLLWQNIDAQLKNLSFEQAYLIALLKKYQLGAKKQESMAQAMAQLSSNIIEIIDSLPKELKDVLGLKVSNVNK